MPRILIDAGHGGRDNGGGSNSHFLEKDMVLRISKKMKELFLEKYDVEVFMTRDKDKYMSLIQRGEKAKALGVDLVISNHINSFYKPTAKGAEIVYSIQNDKKLADMILNELVKRGATKRRTFTKESTVSKGRNWYGILRHSEPIEGVIIEYGFASNKEDTEKILRDWKKYVEGVVETVALYLGLAKKGLTSIIGKNQATVPQMKEWARKRGATEKFISVADLYYKYSKLTGLRGDILYCQSAKETNFGKYTGAVKEEMNNFAGIKIKNPTGDKTYDHESFPTVEEGVRAHFNHLCAYTGQAPVGEPHDRYYVVKSISWAGTIKYAEQLGGKYAPNPDYGYSIVRDYLKDLLNTKVDESYYKNMYFRVLDENQELRKEILALEEKIKNANHRFNEIKKLCEVK